MIKITNRQRKINVDIPALKKAAGLMLKTLKYDDFDLGILLTTNKTIHHFNKTYRHKDKPTDILSFPYHTALKAGERIVVAEPEDKNLGDLIISLEYVQKDAPNWGQSFDERMIVLLAHGIAHVLGYDHETDEEFAVMQKVEKRLLKAVIKQD
jgi:probable rRNA maturation factor